MVRGKEEEEEEEAGYLIFMAALAREGREEVAVVICSAGSGDALPLRTMSEKDRKTFSKIVH